MGAESQSSEDEQDLPGSGETTRRVRPEELVERGRVELSAAGAKADAEDPAKRKEKHPGETTARVSLVEIVQALKDQIAEKERHLATKSRSLIQERNFVENVIASISDCVIVFDHSGQIHSVNAATNELLGYREGELVGRPASVLWARAEQGLMYAGERFQALLDSRRTHSQSMTFRARRGRSIPVAWRGSPILDDRGKVKGYVGVAHDLRSEQRLHEEKLKAVRAMAASVAHEIRNPLGAIQNSVALLLRDLELTGEDRELMEIVREETLRISGIVDQFLRFARPAPPNLTPGSVEPLLRDTMRLLGNDERVGETMLIELELDEALPEVAHDGDRVKQIIWNLATNALDAMGAEGRLVIRARALPKGGLEIAVADDGPGISREMLPRLFEPFVTSKSRGSGLGLPIVKSIMESHRGELRVETAEDVGTTFALIFPGLEAEADELEVDEEE